MAVHLILSPKQAEYLTQFLKTALSLKHAYPSGISTATVVKDKLTTLLAGAEKGSGRLICVVPPSPCISQNKQSIPVIGIQETESIQTV
jgi:hypothetical protein